MHYKDGTEAKVGDLVTGVSHGSGGKPIVGTVLKIVPGTKTCNMNVALAAVIEPSNSHYQQRAVTVYRNGEAPLVYIEARVDLANCSDFDLVHRASE